MIKQRRKIQVRVFWVVTPCNVVGGYHRSPLRWRQRCPPKRWYPTAILRRHNPNDLDLKLQRPENLKSPKRRITLALYVARTGPSEKRIKLGGKHERKTRPRRSRHSWKDKVK